MKLAFPGWFIGAETIVAAGLLTTTDDRFASSGKNQSISRPDADRVSLQDRSFTTGAHRALARGEPGHRLW